MPHAGEEAERDFSHSATELTLPQDLPVTFLVLVIKHFFCRFCETYSDKMIDRENVQVSRFNYSFYMNFMTNDRHLCKYELFLSLYVSSIIKNANKREIGFQSKYLQVNTLLPKNHVYST